MRRQIELANDLGPQETYDIREDGELEAGKDFLGDGRATDHRPRLQHERLLSGLCEIRRGDEPVVPAADHDRVVTTVARRHTGVSACSGRSTESTSLLPAMR